VQILTAICASTREPPLQDRSIHSTDCTPAHVLLLLLLLRTGALAVPIPTAICASTTRAAAARQTSSRSTSRATTCVPTVVLGCWCRWLMRKASAATSPCRVGSCRYALLMVTNLAFCQFVAADWAAHVVVVFFERCRCACMTGYLAFLAAETAVMVRPAEWQK
jgi:hypothetical protein